MSTVTAGTIFEPVIGLEVHAQLATRSKIFCGCATAYGADANTHTCPVCLGMPGVLPVLNREAVRLAVRMVLAVGGTVHPESVFARKNYFYPDLPKGYQISQFDRPLGTGGHIGFTADDRDQSVNLIRIHLEEDAGKSFHPEDPDADPLTRVDLNRCGVPLIEIVGEPEIHSPAAAGAYLRKLRQILRYLDVSTGNMEEGALRCDANVSLRPAGDKRLGTRTELKNLNSFKAVERALAVEIERQSRILRADGRIHQETLLWDERAQTVASMRSKEESSDYRYFPEPDLLPLEIPSGWITKECNALPELPDARRGRFETAYGLSSYDASVLTDEPELAAYFEATVAAGADAKPAANWIQTEVLRVLKDEGVEITAFAISAERLAGLLSLIEGGSISGKIGKDVFGRMLESNRSAEEIVSAAGLAQISDEASLTVLVDELIAANPDQVARYRKGNARLMGFFVGEVMRETGGKANPQTVNTLLKARLDAADE